MSDTPVTDRLLALYPHLIKDAARDMEKQIVRLQADLAASRAMCAEFAALLDLRAWRGRSDKEEEAALAAYEAMKKGGV